MLPYRQRPTPRAVVAFHAGSETSASWSAWQLVCSFYLLPSMTPDPVHSAPISVGTKRGHRIGSLPCARAPPRVHRLGLLSLTRREHVTRNKGQERYEARALDLPRQHSLMFGAIACLATRSHLPTVCHIVPQNVDSLVADRLIFVPNAPRTAAGDGDPTSLEATTTGAASSPLRPTFRRAPRVPRPFLSWCTPNILFFCQPTSLLVVHSLLVPES